MATRPRKEESFPESAIPLASDKPASTAPSAAAAASDSAVASGAANAAAPSVAELPPQLIPGATVIGRGIYLKPRQPYELKDFIFEPGQNQTEVYVSEET